MPNRIHISRCEFHVKSGKVYYGFTAYDDYGQMYDNNLPKEALEFEGLDFLKYLYKNDHTSDEVFSNMMDTIVENEMGIGIDEDWFTWEEIKDILTVSDEEGELVTAMLLDSVKPLNFLIKVENDNKGDDGKEQEGA